MIVGITCARLPAGSVADLVASAGYERAPRGLDEWLRFQSPIATLPAVAIKGGCAMVDRDAPWQWQVGNLAVNLVLALQPEFLFFHAGALDVAGRGVLLMGASGRGKTSVSLALAARGHAYFGDEIGAVRTMTRELVPIPRAAMVRQPGTPGMDPGARMLVPVDRRPLHPVGLKALVCLRAFTDRTTLTPFRPSAEALGLITPMACSLASRGPAQLALDLLRLLENIPCYVLDSASPASAAEAIEVALAG